MKNNARFLVAVLAVALVFGSFGAIAHARDIGSFANIALGAQGSGVDTFTGQVNRVKVHNYSSSNSASYAVVNVQSSSGGFVYRTGTTTGATIYFKVISSSNGLDATNSRSISNNSRATQGYRSGYGYGGLSYKLFLDNNNAYAVTTTGSWCPDAAD